jgi:hypothetical protein
VRQPRRLLPAFAALVVAFGLSGCSPYSGTRASKVQQWAKQNSFASDNDLVVNDIGDLFKAVQSGSMQTVTTICGGLAIDVGTAYDTLPSPDQALTNYLGDADTSIVNAATSCSRISSLGSRTMRRDLAVLLTGISELRKAQRLIASLGVHWNMPNGPR